jgi:imidazole glycerol-phosphate synthase subunit HisH
MIASLYDYGAGNLHSLAKALEAGGARVRIDTRVEQCLDADALVLAGVGAFGAAAERLAPAAEALRSALAAGFPCLGICLGMQLLFEASDEGQGSGIGVLPGKVRRVRARRVPHMGWNAVDRDDDPLFAGTGELVAYYANSFVVEPAEPHMVIARTRYEDDLFPAAVRQNRTWGVQFHPEKSGAPGLRLIRNFINEVRG